MGQAALEGLKGVQRVKKGFRGSKETNTVYYDPTVLTVEEMEAALKHAGTYRGTLR
ncbi:MAG: heavy-metal-associated domain-containing protein [Desulfobacterales bacterium]|nr:MAG: heavy-metal-associated domain-containing protein [Desulfobacterales bacterium]